LSAGHPGAAEPRPLLLIVDDEPSVLQVAGTMVRAIGWNALVSADAEKAVAMYRERADEIDCVLLDLHMPRLNGLAALRAIRDQRPDAHVIVMTGDPLDWHESLARAERPDALLEKPFSLADLRALLEPLARAA